MSPRTHAVALALAALALASPGSASATTVDGVLDPEYGPPLVLQATQSTMSQEGPGYVDHCEGAELDGAYGYIADGTLYLFLAGNLETWLDLNGASEWMPLDLFLDTRPGGQSTLLANNPTIYVFDLKQMAGLTFDPGFEADYGLSLAGENYPYLYAYWAELPSAGGGDGWWLGHTRCGEPASLAGGRNPSGVQATANNLNTAGVTRGCGASSGAGVSTGVEWSIPLAALGNPEGCIKVCALMSRSDNAYLPNQVLGPVPPGTCNLGATGAINFGQIDGDQFFTVCPGSVPTKPASWGSVKARYR